MAIVFHPLFLSSFHSDFIDRHNINTIFFIVNIFGHFAYFCNEGALISAAYRPAPAYASRNMAEIAILLIMLYYATFLLEPLGR